ncbi:hypothetical protein [Synechococcus sp. CBW1107]|uniref:hypothetical protein n=1 Tax=Synechococcus sp. CBW1107 TaxID=2789857 RepID=UPI002AD2D29B|nr:hypothetical protein [Synechococcus sp. CBW1107]CAK6698702.1 hypothetical protein IFHNHDMJ_02486 [Synechococcus sp. CBW1107]
MTPEQAQDPAIHPMAPLIRLTLLGLYLALVLPLPPLAPEGLRLAMAVLVALGLLLVLAVSPASGSSWTRRGCGWAIPPGAAGCCDAAGVCSGARCAASRP